MRILINASNLGGGGGIQVADSICRYLSRYSNHLFVCVLSSAFDNTVGVISSFKNVKIVRYNYPRKDFKSLLTSRNSFLDGLVESNEIDCVLTVFGPMKWKPRCSHICGFAMSQLVLTDSPFFSRMAVAQRFMAKCRIKLWELVFRRSSKCFYTENPLITELVKQKFPHSKVYTITNNYNQVFDQPSEWTHYPLPSFEGIQLLSVTTQGLHKNNTIALDIARILRKEHPDFMFRFVFTLDEQQFPDIPDDLEDCFYFTGRVAISACPSLYDQCDFEFQPTLIECFTATYPEAMVMRKPIITTDLEFARGLCGKAAVYYSPLSAESAADVIYSLSKDKELQQELIKYGLLQLRHFDTSEERAHKLIKLCESIC